MKHVARKRFGQHFLSDAGVLEAIVDLIDPQPGQALVEIGPGLGALTWPLLERCQALTVIELDRDLAARLRQRAGGSNVIEADVLTVDFAALARQTGPAAARWSATCPTTSPRRSCSTCSDARRAGGRPALHAAEGGGRSAWRRRRAARTTAGCR